jgi:hypothetical protein
MAFLPILVAPNKHPELSLIPLSLSHSVSELSADLTNANFEFDSDFESYKYGKGERWNKTYGMRM